MSGHMPRRFILTRSRATDGKVLEKVILVRRDAATRCLVNMIQTAADEQGIGDRPFTRRKIREANKFNKCNSWWHAGYEILDQEIKVGTTWNLDDEGKPVDE